MAEDEDTRRGRRHDESALPSSYQHLFPAQHRCTRHLRRRTRRHRRVGAPRWLQHEPERVRGTADPVQSRAPRRRHRHRLPLLPHLGRGIRVRQHSADQDLHELPLADLEHRADSRTGARQLPGQHAASQWTRVNDLPDFVYFNHSIHVRKGVGCATCHGPVDKMPLVYQEAPLTMAWCLDCHRNPAKYVRPRDQVYNMAWERPVGRPRARTAAGDGIQDRQRHTAHELLDVSQVRRAHVSFQSPVSRSEAETGTAARSIRLTAGNWQLETD